ncbi:endonuclease/exonuclease/phosphatase family protein [Ciceribacter sp. L1K23]|uniref:endonuclease/exonuclease/phosphatase family protein n=1 Tax=Ciceribacter sp. L1K23 TaxID=2820276 RepID=UPI001B83910E|nr:endonuclease/exonuclease/phosphatase family protein [Ciceribacter sp. L1K23]MBR0555220.1 endonuclease/exonuclease/phosphatase family protein [Ciceribacter sp. L1K23]
MFSARATLLAAFVSSILCFSAQAQQPTTELTVMSFNIWGGGANESKGVEETVAAIRAAGADIIGIQETKPEPEVCEADDCAATGESAAARIAEALGFHHFDQSKENPALWANAIISRYPIGKPTANELGVEIAVGDRKVYAFNIHLTDFPYQPYQLLNIEYGPAPFLKTGEEAAAAAKAARGPALDLLMSDLKEADGADAVFLFGDFNEPSHRDWTEAAVKAGHQPTVVEYPTTLRIEKEGGFTDLFRAAFPDEVAKTAFTWTPTSEPTDPEDHHDRIDFTFGKADNLTVVKAGIVGEKAPEADIVVTPWPSDHRASMATVRF